MFKECYREHIQAIRTNMQTSKYAQHMLDTGHTYEYGIIEETMEILQVKRNTLERFHIVTEQSIARQQGAKSAFRSN
jgi:hypothetical protein